MKIRRLKSFIPELFLITSVIYYWTLTSNLLNPFSIGLLAILGYQIISKKATLGLIISAVVVLITLFLVLALISELAEFEVANQNYNNLFIFGSFYLGLNLVLAGFMFFKYLKFEIN
jgi:hypothetical protein